MKAQCDENGGEYCWAITGAAGRSCWDWSGSSVLESWFQLDCLVCTYESDHVYTQSRRARSSTCAWPSPSWLLRTSLSSLYVSCCLPAFPPFYLRVVRRSFLEFAVSALRLQAHTLTYLEFYFWRVFCNITSGHLILQDGIDYKWNVLMTKLLVSCDKIFYLTNIFYHKNMTFPMFPTLQEEGNHIEATKVYFMYLSHYVLLWEQYILTP